MADPTLEIVECLRGTMTPNTEIIIAAQKRLYELERTPGILSILLGLITSPPAGSTNSIRLAAAMRFKRIVMVNWTIEPEDAHLAGSRYVALSPEDKNQVRAHFLPLALLPERFPPVLNQLVDALFVMIRCDLSTHYAHYSGQILAALHAAVSSSTTDSAALATAVEAQLTAFKVVRFSVGSVTFSGYDAACAPVFEVLLPVLESIAAEGGNWNETTAPIAPSILKAIHHATQVYVPACLRSDAMQERLLHLLGGLATRAIPADELQEVAESAANTEGEHVELKSRKWAIRILSSFMHATVPTGKFPKGMKKTYGAWIKNWTTRFAVPVALLMLTVIENHKAGTVPLSDRSLNYLLMIIDESIRNAAVYKAVIKPNISQLLVNAVLPALAISSNDIEQWRADPASFVVQVSVSALHRSTHKDAARRVLIELVSSRTRTGIAAIMGIIQEILTAYATAPDAATRDSLVIAKDGALAALIALRRQLSSKEFAAQTAALIEAHVLPELATAAASSPPILAVRGLDVIASFVSLPYSKNALYGAVQVSIDALHSPDRSLQLEAGNALSKLIRVRSVLRDLRPNAATLLERVLTLMGQGVNETLGIVMRRLLERFSSELVPHAIGIMKQLVALTENALGIVAAHETKFKEAAENDADQDNDFDDEDDAAVEALRTAAHYIDSMAALIDALDNNDEVLAAVEPIVLPVVDHVFSSENSEILGETMRVVQALTYCGSRVSDNLWARFPTVVGALHSNWAAYCVEEIVPSLVNYATANSGKEFFAVPDHVDMLLTVPEKFFQSPEDEASSQRSAILLRTILGNCGEGQAVPYYPRILNLCVPAMEAETNTSFRLLALDCVAAICYHDPQGFIQALMQTGLLGRCFNCWFSLTEGIKSSQAALYPMLGLSSLIAAVPTNALPGDLAQAGHVVVGKLIETLHLMYKAEIEEGGDDDDADGNGGLFDDIDSDADVGGNDDDDAADADDAGDEGDEFAGIASEAERMAAKLKALAGRAREVVGNDYETPEIPFVTDMDRVNQFTRVIEVLRSWLERDGAAFPELAASITSADGPVVPLLNYATKRAGEVEQEREAEDNDEGFEDEDGLDEDDMDEDMHY